MLENRLYKRSNLLKLFSRKYKKTKTIEHMMIDSIDIQENDRILEIGVGNGTVFKSITEKLEKGRFFMAILRTFPLMTVPLIKCFPYIRFRAALILGLH